MNQPPNNKRVLAQKVRHGGKDYTMAIAEAYTDGDGQWNVRIEPFESETHSTVYHNGILVVSDTRGEAFEGPSAEPPVFTAL